MILNDDRNGKIFDAMEQRQNLVIDETQRQALLEYLYLVQEKNKFMNLTSVTTLEEGLILHIEDSLTVVPELLDLDIERFCDVGTGGGFPGVPIAIMTDLEGLLIDSVKKKSQFVAQSVKYLGLMDRIEVLGMRSEELARMNPGSFDAVIMRAVAPLSALLELSYPLLRENGYTFAMKAKIGDDELEDAKRVSKLLGFTLYKNVERYIGDERIPRSILIYKKTGISSIKLPRKPGFERKRPL